MSLVYTRPPASNTSRWALNFSGCGYMIYAIDIRQQGCMPAAKVSEEKTREV